MVTLANRSEVVLDLAVQVRPELLLWHWDDDLNRGDIGDALEERRIDAVVVGPGIPVNKRSEAMLRLVLSTWEGPLVLDAGALSLVAADKELLAFVQQRGRTSGALPAIVTPHPGEAARLLRREIASDEDGRRADAIALARHMSAIVCLKVRARSSSIRAASACGATQVAIPAWRRAGPATCSRVCSARWSHRRVRRMRFGRSLRRACIGTAWRAIARRGAWASARCSPAIWPTSWVLRRWKVHGPEGRTPLAAGRVGVVSARRAVVRGAVRAARTRTDAARVGASIACEGACAVGCAQRARYVDSARFGRRESGARFSRRSRFGSHRSGAGQRSCRVASRVDQQRLARAALGVDGASARAGVGP